MIGLVHVLLIFGLLLSLFVVLGLKRSWRIATPLLLCLAAFALYLQSTPAPADLNESDRMGNKAAHLLLAILAFSSIVAFGIGYAISSWKNRKSRLGAQAGLE